MLRARGRHDVMCLGEVGRCTGGWHARLISLDHLDQIDRLGQYFHALGGAARFKNRLPETVVLLATKNRFRQINIYPKRHGD